MSSNDEPSDANFFAKDAKVKVEKTLSSQTFRMAVKALESMGIPPRPLVAEARISWHKVTDPFARIPIKNEWRFWSAALKKTSDPQLALKMAEHVPFGTYPLLDYVGASCQSIFQTLVIFQKYVELVYGDWNPRLTEGDRAIQFDLGSKEDPEKSRYTSEFGLSVLYKRMNDFSGKKLLLKKVHFPHEFRGDRRAYENFFQTKVLFDQNDTSLFFGKEIKKTPCLNSELSLLGMMLKMVEEQRVRLNGTSGVTSSPLVSNVKNVIKSHLTEGEPQMAKIAKELAMSTRTLQRKLEKEDTSLTALVTAVRKETAPVLLKSPGLSNEEIGFLLGYSNLSAFNRAFRQWFHMTPSAFRKTLT